MDYKTTKLSQKTMKTEDSKGLGEGIHYSRPSIRMIYLCHILSSWGDRMWAFAIGLYLIIIYPKSLKMTAIYGFASSLSICIFGAFIGSWIDKTSRLKVARLSLILQNSAVVISAITLALFLNRFPTNNPSAITEEDDLRLKPILLTLIVLFAVCADLASVANKIALQKDWIVVLSGGDPVKLSALNATMRTIDLVTSICAPIVVGQLVTYISDIAGAISIAGWNIGSGITEYYLLHQIYKSVPELSQKKSKYPKMKVSRTDSEECSIIESEARTRDKSHKDTKTSTNGEVWANNSLLVVTSKISAAENFSVQVDSTIGQALENNLTEVSLEDPPSQKNDTHSSITVSFSQQTDEGWSTKFRNYFSGWALYFSHSVRNAGLGLAALYMTVLGFDHVPIGFARSQGMTGSLIGTLTAFAAIFGVLGSLSFPWLRHRLGKCQTGILGFGLETICLTLCIVSVFIYGSPFEPSALYNGEEYQSSLNSTEIGWQIPTKENCYLFLLLGGIILARFGLWIADLSVTQIFQEEVPEDKRGIVNGVQDSLNEMMNLVKFILVMILPSPHTFGYLVCLSWFFVFMGWMLFISYTFQQRKSRVKGCDTKLYSGTLQEKYTKGN